MTTQQRIYEVTGAPGTGTGHLRDVWTTVLPLNSKGYAWIEADAATYSWPAGTHLTISEVHRRLKLAGEGRQYQHFNNLRGTLNQSPSYVSGYNSEILATTGLTEYLPLDDTSGTTAVALIGYNATYDSANSTAQRTTGPFTDTTKSAARMFGSKSTPKGAVFTHGLSVGSVGTVEIWYRAVNSTPNTSDLCWLWDGNVDYLHYFGLQAVKNTKSLIFFDSAGVGSFGHVIGSGLGSSMQSWNHFALVWDATSYQAYINGVLTGTGTSTMPASSWSTTTPNGVVGSPVPASDGNSGDFWLAGFALYNVQLGAETILSHYDAR